MKSVIKQSLAAAAIVVAGVFPARAAEYVMSASADYSGPFADVMPSAMSGIQAVANWWNKEVGKGLGVKVDIKISDMRYDAAVIARTWPSILSRDNPIMHLGFGSPDLTTLMKRLPDRQGADADRHRDGRPGLAAERLAFFDPSRPTAMNSRPCSARCKRTRAASC